MTAEHPAAGEEMKLAIISDLHSNREALEAVFADIRSKGLTDLICLGDVVGYGPEPEFCVDLVRGHARWCLMGNHDEALFRDASDFNPHARGAIDYTRRRMQPHWCAPGTAVDDRTDIFGNADDDYILFDQTKLGGQTNVFGPQSNGHRAISSPIWID